MHGGSGHAKANDCSVLSGDDGMLCWASQADGLARLEQVKPSLQCFGRGPPPGRHLNTSPVSKQRPPRLFTNRPGIKTKSTSKNSQSHEEGELDKIRFEEETL